MSKKKKIILAVVIIAAAAVAAAVILGQKDVYKRQAQTQAQIDSLVVALVKKQHEKAAQILLENREKLVELSEYLYTHETITGEEFMGILNS